MLFSIEMSLTTDRPMGLGRFGGAGGEEASFNFVEKRGDFELVGCAFVKMIDEVDVAESG